MFHALPVSRYIRNWEEAQLGQLIQTDQRDIPYCRMPWSVCKLRGVGWEGPVAAQGLCGHWLVVVSNCNVHHLFSWVLTSLSLSPLLLTIIVITTIITTILTLLLYFTLLQLFNCSFLNPQGLTFQSSPPSH